MTVRAALTGRVSRTRLVFAVHGGATRLAVSDAGAPLKVLRAFPLDDGRALLQIVSASPGLLGGDRYEIEIVADAGARAIVVTPAATKIHSMPDGAEAVQTVRLRVAAGAALEYCPALNIPFPDAALRQSVEAEVEAGGRLAVVESYALGRIGRGERRLFRRIESRVRIDYAGAPWYRDGLEIDRATAEEGAFEGRNYLASGVWAGPFPELPAGPPNPTEPVAWGALGTEGWWFRGLYADGVEAARALAEAHRRAAEAWGFGGPAEVRYTL